MRYGWDLRIYTDDGPIYIQYSTVPGNLKSVKITFWPTSGWLVELLLNTNKNCNTVLIYYLIIWAII